MRLTRNTVSPAAKMLIAIPLTIWSARNWIETTAWIEAINPPAMIATAVASQTLCQARSATTAKNAPVSIMPSIAMFTTPLRSEMTPPRAGSRRELGWQRGRRATEGQAPPDRADKVGGDAEEDERLQDKDQVARDAGVALHDRAAGVQRPEQQRREDDAESAAQAEQRDSDGIEPGRVAEVLVRQVVVDTGDLDGSREAREGARNEHGDDDRTADADARVAGRLLALTHSADLIAEGGPPQQKRKSDRSDKRDQQPRVH